MENGIKNINITNIEKIKNFVKKDNKKSLEEILNFCQKNHIQYIYFESLTDLFNYYDEEEYQSFTNDMVDIFCKNGELIKILN